MRKENFIKNLIKNGKTWFILSTVIIGVTVNALGYTELPWKVKKVASESEAVKTELDKFIAVSVANQESQKQLNVQQNAMIQQQMQQQVLILNSLLPDKTKKRDDN